MKKLFFSSILFLLTCLYVSCNSGTTTASGPSDQEKKNLAANDAVGKMFESGDFSKLGDYIATDAIDHSGPMGEVKGLDSIKAMFNMFASTMKDTKIDIVKEMADGDYVMAWIKQSWTATQDDPMMHLKAGDRASMDGVEVTKYNSDGKVVEHWGFMSMSDMMKMMPQQGNMGSMNPTAPKDSSATKK